MTATATTATATTTNDSTATAFEVVDTVRPRHLTRDGLLAGAVAGVANVAVAASAHAAGVSLELPEGGESIPFVGFAQITVIAAVIGIVLAAVLRRRAANPARTFVRLAVGLVAVAAVPPLLVGATAATVVVLEVTHLVAAAIVIPAVARRLPR